MPAMPGTLLGLLLLAALEATAAVEIGTFSAADIVVCRLRDGSNDSFKRVASLELEFRTSHANSSALISLRNDFGEQFLVLVTDENQLELRLTWLTADNGSFVDEMADSAGVQPGLEAEFKLTSLNLMLDATGVGSGEWRRISVDFGTGGALKLDENQVSYLPENFTTRFAWNDTVKATVGGGFRGCLANASLDGDVQLPLHSASELINRTGSASYFLVDTDASQLPGGGSGCRQDPCPCLNGTCIYQRWNLFSRCNCSQGYEGQRCESEWNTCMNLDVRAECLNGGTCINLPGPLAYKCSCNPSGRYVGTRCQSFNHCSNPVTCQNGANCSLNGDPEVPEQVNYMCACTQGFTGRNCSEPETGVTNIPLIVGVTVGLIAVLLLLIAALVAIKVVRDRRRESGAYRPSQRETVVNSSRTSVYADQTIGMSQVMRPPKEERFI